MPRKTHISAARSGVSLLALTIAGLLATPVLAQQVGAQQAPPPADDTVVSDIVVTGFRSSLAAALNAKRVSSGVVDVIKAEDIAKFPDANLAEALQRVPGVAIVREGGEGRTISVRGLGADFTRVRLNGLEAQAVSSGFTGLINRGRGFDFNVFASELFKELTVRKTPSAEVEEGSLGATVDLATARPFDFTHFTMAASAKLGYNDLGKSYAPRGAFLIADTFADDKFGFVFSAAYNKSQKHGEGYNSGQWDTMASNNGFCVPSRAPTATNPSACFGIPASGISDADLTSTTIFHPRFPRYGSLNIKNERLGLTGGLQWRPTDRTEVSLDALYARHQQFRQNFWLTSIGFNRGTSQQGKPEMIIRQAEIQNNNLVYARIDNMDMRSENEIFDSDSKFTQLGLEVKHQFSDRIRGNAHIGRSQTRFYEFDLLLQADRINSQGYTYDMRGHSKLPIVDFGFNVMDPNSYYIGPLIKSPYSNPAAPTVGLTGPDIRIRPNWVNNTFQQADGDIEADWSDALKFKAGASYREYTVSSDTQRVRNENGTPALPTGVTNADLMMGFDGLTSLKAPSPTRTTWLVPSVAGYDKAFGILSNTGRYELVRDTAAARADIWSVTERDTAAYLQANFDYTIGSWRARGDAGIRYVRTGQSSTGYQEAGTATAQSTVKRHYDNILPAMNLALEPNDDLVLRFSASKVMSRASLTQLIPTGSVNAIGGQHAVTSGNPFLKPIEAKTADAAIEWYFGSGSIVSAGFVYKDIKTYIQTLRETRPFSTSGLPASVLNGTPLAVTDLFDFSVPINTKGGPLKGMELNFQTPFRFLPGLWSNFGMMANYTFTSSKIDYVINATTGQTSTQSLVGLSKHSANGTLYYEDKKFSARTSLSYRSAYLRQVPSRSGQDSTRTGGSFNVDGSLSYKWNKDLSFSLEGINLTNEPEYRDEDSIAHRPESLQIYGREFYLGVRYNF
jgi:iron complex outermembrane receptor protein